MDIFDTKRTSSYAVLLKVFLFERLIKCLISGHSSNTIIKTTTPDKTGPKSRSLVFELADPARDIELLKEASNGNTSNNDEITRRDKDNFLYFEGITALNKIGDTNNNGTGSSEIILTD
jgi:hypothetical protein